MQFSSIISSIRDGKINAFKAVGISAAYYLCHVLTAPLSAFFTMPILIHRYESTHGAIEDLQKAKEYITPQLSVLTALFGDIISAILLIGLILWLAKKSLHDQTDSGIAFTIAHPSHIIQGTIYGAAFYVGILLTNSLFQVPGVSDFAKDQTVLYTQNSLYLVTFLNILRFIICVPAEELLCRGIIFGGITKSYGKIWAAVISTLIFVTLHIPVLRIFDLFTLVMLSVFALTLRLQSKSLAAPIAFHFTYNMVLMLVVILGIAGR